MPHHVVKQGDYLARLAHRFGCTPDAIWDASENEALKARRGDGNVLHPGDLLFIPEGAAREAVSLDLQSTNKFKATVPKTRTVLRLKGADGQALSSEPWELRAAGQRLSGTSDGEGEIAFEIRVTTRRAELHLTRRDEIYDLDIGGLDPVEEVSGAQARLRHLRLYTGPIDGVLGDATRDAIRAFQRAQGLGGSGELDAATTDALRRAYGC